jgi:hydrogenase/urease accessory protein HupE
MTRWQIALVLVPLFWAQPAAAHELRPGFLEITEIAPARYDVRFKVPARGTLRLRMHPRFPPGCAREDVGREHAGTAFIDRFSLSCEQPLTGQIVVIDGLAQTFTDVVARVAHADGAVQTARLTPDQPLFTVTGAPTWLNTARTYFLLGVQHILMGVDHLLFVLALLLLIRDRWMLVKTITAFTLAHSITLAAAALGWAEAPQAPVEAVVALSIVYMAAEVPRVAGAPSASLARASPWIVAFAFGLLHGFGFGGALKEIGLPESDVPLALLTFNLGVEAGQLLFVFAVLALRASLDRLLALRAPALPTAMAYCIGAVAAFWAIERVAGLGL